MNDKFQWKQIPVNLCFAVAAIQPFWKAKPEVYRKVLEERAVMVSAQSSPKIKLTGGGVVEVPNTFAFEEVQKYEKLDAALDFIENVKWDKENSEIDLDVNAFGLNAHLLVAITPSLPTQNPSYLRFVIRKGWMQGLDGRLTLENLNKIRTEVGLDAELNESKGFFSRIFWSLTLEGVMKKTAESIRSYLEKEWKKQNETKS